MKSTQALLCALCAVLVLAGGCIEMRQELRLKSDLSGSVSMNLVYDLGMISEGVVLAMSSGGGKGPAMKMPPEQLESMKQMMLQNIKTQMASKFLSREEIESQLPAEGIRLENFEIREKGNIVSLDAKFAFDHVSKIEALRDIKFEQEQEGQQMQGMNVGAASSNPYEHLKIEEQGEYLVISHNLAQDFDPAQYSQIPPQMQGLMKKAGDKGIFLRIRLPYQKYELVEHTADSVDQKNHTLYWLYNFDKLRGIAAQGKVPEPVYVKMRRR